MVTSERPAGRVASVNVGMPRDVTWHGRTVRTAVWKQPVAGPRMVRRLNIDGDGQGDLAGHGGEQRAVFVYQVESYRYWEQQLGRADFGYGQFGENFTVEGLADDQVCIGDRYRIGGAVFEVTQPRVTCYRVGAGPAQTPGIAAAARPPHLPAGKPGSGPLVAFARSDLSARWDPGYASLLELAEACDVPVRWSCRTGVCHTCETALMSGTVGYAPDPVDDPADGSALICCAQPRDDLVLDL